MKRLFKAILLSLVAILVVGMPVLAAVAYRATYTIIESAGTPYSMLPVLELADNEWMAANGFFKTTALDTRIETLGGLEKPHLVVDDQTMTAVAVPADSQTNLYFTTANADSDMDIIVGYGGKITVADDADLELGNTFEIEIDDAYIDTSASAGKDLVFKDDSFWLYVSDATDITATMDSGDFAAAFPTVDATSQGSVVVNATNHTVTYPAGLIVGDLLMVFFTTDSNPVITPPAAVGFTTLYDEIGVAAAARTMCVYKVVDGTEGVSGVFVTADVQMTSYVCFRISGYSGVPEKSAVVTVNNVNPNSANLAPSWGNQWTLWISHVGYDGLQQNTINAWPANYVDNNINEVPADNEGADTGISTRNLAAASDDPGQYILTGANEWIAHTIGIAPEEDLATVTVTGVASGILDILVEGDGATLDLTVKNTAGTHQGNSPQSVGLGGVSCHDVVGGTWLIMDNSTTDFMFYMGYYKHTTNIGGYTLKAWYQPNTIIIGTELVDRQDGDEPGVITWGANPAGIGVTLGGMVSTGQPTPGSIPADPAQDILPETAVTDWFIEPAVGTTLLNNPLRPFVIMMSGDGSPTDTNTLTEIQAWRILALAIILLITVATAISVGRHQGITAIMAGVAILGAVVLTIFPMWALVFAIGMFIGGLVMERSPSL